MKITLLFLFSLLIFFSCSNPTDNNEQSYDMSILGSPGQIRTYYETVKMVYPGTSEPFIFPQDSILQRIDFPDSLYLTGIFSYHLNQVDNSYSKDTLIINQNMETWNLFFEILNETHGISSDGNYSSSGKEKFLIIDNNIYRCHEIGNELIFKLPIITGINYISKYNNSVISIISREDITTQAGTYNSYKIQVVTPPNSGIALNDAIETFYYCPDVGLIKYNFRQMQYAHKPLDNVTQYIIEYFVEKELISID
jgi:hypothetical protein